MSKNLSDDRNAIQALYRALKEPEHDVDTMSAEEVRAFLVSEGFDPARLHASLASRVKQVEGRLRLQRAGAEYKSVANRLAKIGTRIASTVGDTKEEVLRRLENLQLRQPELAAAMFRKFEQADEVDFQALCEDLMRLDVLGDNSGEN